MRYARSGQTLNHLRAYTDAVKPDRISKWVALAVIIAESSKLLIIAALAVVVLLILLKLALG